MDGSEERLNAAIVVVTHNRQHLLTLLLRSILSMQRMPAKIIVVDNASNDGTQAIIAGAMSLFPRDVVVNCRQALNGGGAGGFAAGVKAALHYDVEWMWLIDDDVEVVEDGLERLMRWGDRFDCIHGQRLDANGRPFFFNPFFSEWLGVPLISFAKIDPGEHRVINVGCFEGMLVRSAIVRALGPPDYRFFLTWDDAMYGWLISKRTPVVLTADVVLRKTRSQQRISLGVRHLNDASDTFRYYVMRNRYLVARYLKSDNCYSPLGFAIGTAMVFAKEIVRLAFVERRISGFSSLLRGYFEYRARRHDAA